NPIGNPLDTTIALQHLIFEGTLDRFPGLKIIAAHGGGYLASYAARSDHACFVSPKNCNPEIKLKKKPSEYLNQLYFDALVFTPDALRHLVAQVGASQVMLRSDHPIPWDPHPVHHVFATTTLTDDEKIALLGGNAARLFGMHGEQPDRAPCAAVSDLIERRSLSSPHGDDGPTNSHELIGWPCSCAGSPRPFRDCSLCRCCRGRGPAPPAASRGRDAGRRAAYRSSRGC